MLVHPTRRQAPALLRQYATQGTALSLKKQGKKNAKPDPPKAKASSTPPPKPVLKTSPPASLRTRLLMSGQHLYNAQQQPNAYHEKGNEEPTSLTEEQQQLKLMDEFEEQAEWLKSHGRSAEVLSIPLLDLMLPYAVNFKTRSEYPSARAMYDQFLKNRLNDGKNAFSLMHLANSHSIPGITLPALGWFRSLFHVTPRLLQTRSLKSNAWVAPIRQDALELYLKLHTCLAKGDSVRIEKLTKDPYTTEILLQVRTRRGMQYYWNFHGEVSPTRILSLRATDVDFSKTMPASGSRVTVQALVRFDIEQSVEIYDNTGKALHVPRVTAEPQPARSGKIKRTVPAERKRVIEYLVMEKPMHLLDAEWSFRQQMFPLVGRTVAA